MEVFNAKKMGTVFKGTSPEESFLLFTVISDEGTWDDGVHDYTTVKLHLRKESCSVCLEMRPPMTTGPKGGQTEESSLYQL